MAGIVTNPVETLVVRRLSFIFTLMMSVILIKKGVQTLSRILLLSVLAETIVAGMLTVC